MLKVSLRNILAHKGRFVMTTFAVVMSVAFVVSSFVLSDTIAQTFRDLFGNAYANTDVVVRTAGGFDTGPGGIEHAPVPVQLAAKVKAVKGVAHVNPRVGGLIPALLKPDGKSAVPNTGPPTLGQTWGEPSPLVELIAVTGRRPRGPHEAAIDETTFKKYHFELGHKIKVQLASGNAEYKLVGALNRKDGGGFAGVHVVAWDLPTAQKALGRTGVYNDISVGYADGANSDEVTARLKAALPKGIETVSGSKVADETASTFEVISGVIGGVMLGFAGVALFVSAFLIFNTFSIILGQRTSELALLRAVGASPNQVRTSVMAESFGLAVIASTLGIGVGVYLAKLLQALMRAIGFDLPSQAAVLETRTVILGFAVGMTITLAASVIPAVRASGVPPLAALRADFDKRSMSKQRRVVIGGGLLALGAFLLADGLFLAHKTRTILFGLGSGAMLVFLGVSVLSALFAGRVAGVLGKPVEAFFSTPGRLSKDNAARNPQRTASTAAALTIGLALVTMATVVGASLKASVKEQTDSAILADYFVSPGGGFNQFGFSPAVGNRIAELDTVEASSPLRFNVFKFTGNSKQVTAIDPTTAAKVLDIQLLEGDYADLGPKAIFIHKDPAEDLHLKVGDTVPVEFSKTGKTKFKIAGIYEDATLADNYVISTKAYDQNFTDPLDQFVAIKAAKGVDEAELTKSVKPILKGYPQLSLKTSDDFIGSQSGQVDQLLIVINVLLLLAVIIAVIGIANTLALSVLERTHEIGLLRAVGMTRRQTRRMVRWEAAIVSTFGATIGVAIGIVFGLAALTALPSTFVTAVSVPVPNLISLIVFAMFAGLLAAFFPARRAGKLDVLAAIAAE